MPVECYFLDVGQGTGNVLLINDGRAIVIDCGPAEAPVALKTLSDHHVHTIEALILSHSC